MSSWLENNDVAKRVKVFITEVFRAYWVLLKIMLPALVVVRLLEQAGATDWLAYGLSPLMSSMGLPSELGLVWATAALTNIYTAMVVFYDVAGSQTYSISEVSTLGVLILVSHALPIEGAVAKLLGVSWRFTILLRIVSAYLLGLMTFWTYQILQGGGEPALMLWQPATALGSVEVTWLNWGLEQLQVLASVLVILASLMALLRLLRWFGVEALLGTLLKPLMKLMTVNQSSANVTIVGLLLGLSFGAGLLIDESRSGRISKRDMQIVACFLGLCHSVIEDTLLILLLGASVVPILIGRTIFACVVIAILARKVFPKNFYSDSDTLT